MNRQLSEIGTIPITTSIIESLYPELKSADKKVIWLEKQGYIVRLKRELPITSLYFPIRTYTIGYSGKPCSMQHEKKSHKAHTWILRHKANGIRLPLTIFPNFLRHTIHPYGRDK